jgi:tetratricopeptide (TPR) repeat protein
MSKKNSSSLSEIKSLDERLTKDPYSFCFARLSELYLQEGLATEALQMARQGVAKHPGYLAGQRALAMACSASGLHDESRSILEQVTAAMPEDTAAQEMLASLYVDAGDKASAIRAYATLLDFRPDDAQSRARLEELQQTGAGMSLPSRTMTLEENIDEDVYELSEDDIYYEDEEEELEPVPSPAGDVSSPVHHDPLSTLTLAELYEQQGFVAKALDIYRSILTEDPANAQLQAKISQLEQQESVAAEAESIAPVAFEDTAALSHPPAMASTDIEDITISEPEPFAPAVFDGMPAPVEAQAFSPLVNKQADNVTGTLESWLENIRRIKACR